MKLDLAKPVLSSLHLWPVHLVTWQWLLAISQWFSLSLIHATTTLVSFMVCLTMRIGIILISVQVGWLLVQRRRLGSS